MDSGERRRREKALDQTVLPLATRENHQPKTVGLLSQKPLGQFRVVGG